MTDERICETCEHGPDEFDCDADPCGPGNAFAQWQARICPARSDRCQVDAYCYPGMCRRLAGHGGQAIYAPLGGFVLLLAKGWRLPLVVEPMAGGHGDYSVLMTRGT